MKCKTSNQLDIKFKIKKCFFILNFKKEDIKANGCGCSENKSSRTAAVPGHCGFNPGQTSVRWRGMESWTFHETPNTPPATLLRRFQWFYFQDYLFRISQFTPLLRHPPPTDSAALSRPDERPFQ